MTGELAGVAPPENLTPDRLGDEKAILGTSCWAGMGALGCPDSRLKAPGDNPHDPGRRENRLRVGIPRGTLTREQARERVRTHVLRAGPVGEGEVEMAEQESPARLSGTQPLRIPDVD